MPKSILILGAALVLGVALALISIWGGVPTGWIGGAALIGWTMLTRRHWAKMQSTTGLEPGGPERVLRFTAFGTALLFGHMATSFAFPEIDLHVGSGNFLAVDSWTMILAVIIASVIVRKDRNMQDERDRTIVARGTKAGYLALIIILILFSFFLAFVPARFVPELNFFVVANAQIAIVLASLLVKYSVQLVDYDKDTKLVHASAEVE